MRAKILRMGEKRAVEPRTDGLVRAKTLRMGEKWSLRAEDGGAGACGWGGDVWMIEVEGRGSKKIFFFACIYCFIV